MAQSTLESLLGKPSSLESLLGKPPEKPKRGLGSRLVSAAISPIDAISKASQELANKVEGVDRPIEETHKVEVPETGEGWAKALVDLVNPMREGNLLTAPFEAVYHAQQATPDAVRALIDQPVAAIRGGTAGVITGAGQLSPVDIATMVAGRFAGGRGARSSPGSKTARAGGPPASAPSGGVVKPRPGAPDVSSAGDTVAGSRLIKKKVDPASQTMEAKIAAAVQEAIEEGKKRQSQRTDLPPSEPPPMPRAQGRAGGSTQHDVGGNLGHVEDSVRSAVDAAIRAARSKNAPDADAKMPPMKKTVIPEKNRKPREEAKPSKLEDLDENSTIKEVADAVNAVARKEPEVLAPRDPKLEQLAAEMEAQPKAPNKAANRALVAETVPGASGKLQMAKPRPPSMDRPIAKEIGPVDEAGRPLGGYAGVDRRTADRGGPEGVDRRAVVDEPIDVMSDPIAAARRMRAENPDIDVQAQAMRDKAAKAGRIKEPAELQGRGKTVAAKPEVAEPVSAKVDDPDVYDLGEISSPVKAVGISKAEAKQLVKEGMDPQTITEWNALLQTENRLSVQTKKGLLDGSIKPKTPDERIYKQLAESAEIGPEDVEFRAKYQKSEGDIIDVEPVKEPKALPAAPVAAAAPPKLPPMKSPKKMAKADLPAEEVPVTKVAAAAGKPAMKVEGGTAKLTPQEQVRFTMLEKRVPESTKKLIQEGKLPKVSDPNVAEFKTLYEKSHGKVTPAAAAPRVVAQRPPDVITTPTKGGTRITVDEMKTAMEEVGKTLPAELRKKIDDGTFTALNKAEVDKLAGGNPMKLLDDVMAYTGWRSRITDTTAALARTKEIDNLANSTVAAAAKREGATPPKTESVVARSEKVAEKIALPKPDKVPEIPAKVAQAAIDEVMGGKNVKIRPYLTPEEIGPAPKGVDAKLWRTVNANVAEGRRLYKERGIIDRRIVDTVRRFFGADEAARRLGLPKDTVAELSGVPHKRRPMQQVMSEMDADLQKRADYLMEDPKGFMRTEALLAGSGAAAGGLVGAAIGGEAVEDKFAAAVSLALIGSLAGYGGGKAVKNVKVTGAKAKAMWEELDTANLLLGPAAVKASLGSVGGVAAGVWQRFREGRKADAVRGIKFMAKEAPGMYLNVLTGPMKGRTQGKVGSLTSNVQKQAGGISTGILNQVLRPFVAADTTGKTALKRMGFSEDEALRMMMNGEPTSWQGQSLLRLINSTWTTRMLAKFPRVRIGSIERGIEFTPGLSGRFSTRTAHKAEKIGKSALRARAEFGGAALVAGTAYGYFRDPGFMEAGIASAATGPAFLPAAAGIAAGRGLRRGGPMRALLDAAVEVGDATPQIADTNIRTTVSGERFLPLRPIRRAFGME